MKLINFLLFYYILLIHNQNRIFGDGFLFPDEFERLKQMERLLAQEEKQSEDISAEEISVREDISSEEAISSEEVTSSEEDSLTTTEESIIDIRFQIGAPFICGKGFAKRNGKCYRIRRAG